MPEVLPEYKYYIDKECLYLFEQFVNSDNHGDKTLGRVRLRKKKIPLSLGPS